jgi:hypothetical protein
MKAKLLHIARTAPLFLVLLPLFFMLHGLNENFVPDLTNVALKQTLFYAVAGFLMTILLVVVFRSLKKAALFSFFLLLFNFFFGSAHDLAKKTFGLESFFVKYGFIIALAAIAFLCLAIWLKRTKREFPRTFVFLNLLFLLLAVFEIVTVLPKLAQKDPYHPPALSSQFKNCDSCAKPDVYVIIADEYAGDKELKEVFSIDNSEFENELRTRGFHIAPNTSSNYNATVYSMAALFNMGYVELNGNGFVTQQDMLLCRSIIKQSNTGLFFKDRGYETHNFSFFELEGKPKAVNNYYFPPKRKIFLSQTFISRFRKEVSYNFFSKKKKEAVEKNDYNNDETVDRLTRELAAKKTANPKFVYTHFTRPHHPYYVDRNGQPSQQDSLKGFDRIKKEYTEHLLYTNKRLLSLVDHIKNSSATPPVILLASDHGFRQFIGQGEKPYYFMNLCAAYLPNGQYSGFYDGMSPVNTFRVILNTAFGQQLPLLKDSSVFLVEKQ